MIIFIQFCFCKCTKKGVIDAFEWQKQRTKSQVKNLIFSFSGNSTKKITLIVRKRCTKNTVF